MINKLRLRMSLGLQNLAALALPPRSFAVMITSTIQYGGCGAEVRIRGRSAAPCMKLRELASAIVVADAEARLEKLGVTVPPPTATEDDQGMHLDGIIGSPWRGSLN